MKKERGIVEARKEKQAVVNLSISLSEIVNVLSSKSTEKIVAFT